VYTTLCETSTATVFDIENISKIIRDNSEAILVVDAISGLGQDILKTDEWEVDIVVSSSQKGFMLPPGLSFISISKKAEEFLKKSNLPKYYFDLKKALSLYDKPDTPFTPSVSLIIALNETLKIIKKEGIEKRWEEFSRIALALRKSLESIGFKIFSKRPSSSVTAALKEGLDTTLLVKKMRKEYKISIAGGQAHLKGKIIRIAHMGYINAQDVVMCLSVLEKAMRDLGDRIPLGKSLEIFQEVYYV